MLTINADLIVLSLHIANTKNNVVILQALEGFQRWTLLKDIQQQQQLDITLYFSQKGISWEISEMLAIEGKKSSSYLNLMYVIRIMQKTLASLQILKTNWRKI